MAVACKKSSLEIERAIEDSYRRLENTDKKSPMFQFMLGELACLLWLTAQHPFDKDYEKIVEHVKTARKLFLIKGSKPCPKPPVA